MARPNQNTRYMIIIGYMMIMGDMSTLTAPCPLCEMPTTLDTLASPDMPGFALAHDTARHGNPDACWCFACCYPACSDCNGDDGATDAPRQSEVRNSDILAVLMTDYRTSRKNAQDAINRAQAVIEGRKAARRAKRGK